jgi:GNAT superfamily N-acetyltransferase
MSSMISIRLGVMEDIPIIMTMIREHVVPKMKAVGNTQWGDDYPNAEVFEDDVRLGQLYVACIASEERMEELVGAGAITTEQCHEYQQCGLDTSIPCVSPHRLAAHPNHAGRGIGRMLMLQAEEVCRKKSIDRIRGNINTSANIYI